MLDAVRVIENSGVSLTDVKDRATVDAFLGPTDPKELEALPALDAAESATKGSGRYGDAWQLPLGHEARASVGVRLALLVDRRNGVGLRADGLPNIYWRHVDGGEVTVEIRANPDDVNSKVVNRLTRTVASFWMARYPITIAQFRAFLGECHREGRWHLPPGFRFELPADDSPPKHRARHGNHLADSVNWFDSMAFCHWLSASRDMKSGYRRNTSGSGPPLAATPDEFIPGARTGTRSGKPGEVIPRRVASPALRPSACIRPAPPRRIFSTWRATSGSGVWTRSRSRKALREPG